MSNNNWNFENVLPDERHLENDSTRNHFSVETEHDTSIEVWYDITNPESKDRAIAFQ